MDPYVGEIRMFGGNYAPLGWMFCNGQILPISEYQELYALIGTTYGGDGVTTFALPDLQGRLPIHTSPQYPLGQAAGTESVTLTTGNLPGHSHLIMANNADAETANPSEGVFSGGSSTPFYAPANPDKGVALNAATVGIAGQNWPHDNMQPFLCVSFIIAMEGIFPQQG